MSYPAIELTSAIADRLVEATSKGLIRKVAARCAGISPETFYKWLRLGRKGIEPYAQLVQRLKEAQSRGEMELVDIIKMHAADTWQAGAWLLERRYPERYALKQKISHEVQLTPEQARAKFKEITGKEWGE